MKKLIVSLLVLSLMTVVLVACGGSSGNGGSSTGNGTDVHMNATNFVQSSVTIQKGQSLNLIDDVAVTHIIENGSWVSGTAQPKTESGAPKVNLTFSGSDTQTVGPFNTAGTYHLYCTIHTGMNLTVIVQ